MPNKKLQDHLDNMNRQARDTRMASLTITTIVRDLLAIKETFDQFEKAQAVSHSLLTTGKTPMCTCGKCRACKNRKRVSKFRTSQKKKEQASSKLEKKTATMAVGRGDDPDPDGAFGI